MKNLLMVCYYFPPLGLAGTQRALKFARYLPEFGWRPSVLTVKPIAYWAQDPTLLHEIADIKVIRTESWDPQRVLARVSQGGGSAAGSAPADGWLSLINAKLIPLFFTPDSKILWKIPALRTVKRLLKEQSFDAIYSTSPPHSVQLIAAAIKRRTGLPWVADFRDSWAGSVVVREPTRWHRQQNQRLQHRVVRKADAVVAVTPSIQRQLLRCGAGVCEWIPNGFDPNDYPPTRRREDARFVLCHCGTVTEFSRPDTLLQAVRLLKQRYPELCERLVLRFVGYDATGRLPEWIQENRVSDQVEYLGYLSHHQALQELVDADALLLIARGRADFAFVPGKTYEYIGSRKPVLLLSDVPDTLDLLSELPQVTATAPDDPETIARHLASVIRNPKKMPQDSDLSRFERREQTGKLAELLNRCVRDNQFEE